MFTDPMTVIAGVGVVVVMASINTCASSAYGDQLWDKFGYDFAMVSSAR
jgi:hypothetical protein